MPTAARKQRDAEKRRQAEQDAAELAVFDRLIAQLSPAQMESLQNSFLETNDLVFDLPPYLRLKGGLVGFDENGDTYLSEKAGRDAGKGAHEESIAEGRSLKRKYSKVWGKRGYPKKIALETGFSVETVRRYFRLYP